MTLSDFVRTAALAPKSIHQVLEDDHADLQRLLCDLLEAADADVDWRSLVELWGQIERRLLAHFDAEEALVFTRLAQRDWPMVNALLEEHRVLRARLEELGVAVELHMVQSPQLHELVRDINRHAAAETETVYRWADEQVERDMRPGLVVDLLAALRRDGQVHP